MRGTIWTLNIQSFPVNPNTDAQALSKNKIGHLQAVGGPPFWTLHFGNDGANRMQKNFLNRSKNRKAMNHRGPLSEGDSESPPPANLRLHERMPETGRLPQTDQLWTVGWRRYLPKSALLACCKPYDILPVGTRTRWMQASHSGRQPEHL